MPEARHPAQPKGPASRPLNPVERLAFAALLGSLWVARRLPDKPLYRIAFAVGAGLYVLLPARRARVRDNLRRVIDWLVANEKASPRVVRAAHDRTARERMVRAAFGHWVMTYAEAALGPRYSGAELKARFVPYDAGATSEAMAAPPPGAPGPIHMAMHFGSVDLSALYGARVGAVPLTGPMEFVESPFARAYFDHVRNGLGVTIVPLDNAAEALTAALARGEAIGIVADRNIAGRGQVVSLFGAPVRLPIGPALLSVTTGARLYLEAIERTGPGEWLGHTVRLQPPPGVTRREATRAILEQEVRAFERIIARAPEQWTTLFFPIWEGEAEQ